MISILPGDENGAPCGAPKLHCSVSRSRSDTRLLDSTDASASIRKAQIVAAELTYARPYIAFAVVQGVNAVGADVCRVTAECYAVLNPAMAVREGGKPEAHNRSEK